MEDTILRSNSNLLFRVKISFFFCRKRKIEARGKRNIVFRTAITG